MYGKETDRKTTDIIRIDQPIIEEKNSSGATIRKYTRGKLIGKGGFAKCYELFPHENNKKYAVKVIEKASLTRSKAKEKLASEIKIHKSLKSDHVVDFEHFFQDPNNVYIVLQLCPNQTLGQLIKRRKRITEIQAKFYLHQIASGINDIQKQKVVHRDLKLGNLFLTDKLEIRIGDFGLAAKINFDGQKRKTMCGTPNYIAPEILENSAHSYEVDIWSLGVIAYALIIGRPPFETNDVKLTYSKIKSCNYSFPDAVSISSTAKKFIAKMLIRDPSRRSTIEEILQDQFFTSCAIPTVLPITVLGQPPNQNFLKKFEELKTSHELQQSSKQNFSKRETLSTERYQRKDKTDSITGRMLVRANSIDRVDKKNAVVQRASSSAALMVPKKNSQNLAKVETRMLTPNIQPLGPQVWVTYSEQNPKFGVCYVLNSNATGMKFNDSTYMISNSNFTKIKYYPNTKETSSKGELYDVADMPESLNKKMKIISYYYKELKTRKQTEENKMSNEERIQREKYRHRENHETAMNIYVVKHFKTSKVHIFWFNNEDYQVIFKDHSELQVSKDHVNYVNKYGERKYFHKSSLQNQSQDVKKRMSHTQTLFKKIKQTTKFDKNSENNSNKQNQPTTLVRSSSVSKVEKPKYTMMKGCASVTRLASYKFIK